MPTTYRLAPLPRPDGPAAWWLAILTVLLQICYPLVHGHLRDELTVLTVIVFAMATLAQLVSSRGTPVAVGFLIVTLGVGFLVEAVGTNTGRPFGHYVYDGSLGPRLHGVPLVIPLAWTMMSWPALAAARRLVTSRRARAVVGGWALASWDLFLDPQMVAAGHWRWSHPSPGLPGIHGIPLTNYLGWLLVSIALMAALDRIIPIRGSDEQPLALYLWTYASSVLANLVFFGRPGVALVGGIGMGLVALPLALRLR